MTENHQNKTPSLLTLALQPLEDDIANCRRCAEQGYTAITRPIERGQAQKRIWLIGQAPGLYEGERKMAFGGPAGRTLMNWLARCGLSEAEVRRDFYLSAVTKCYPGRAAKGAGDRNPTPTERSNCRSFLLREMAILRPKLVVLVGGTAIKEVYGQAAKLEHIIGQINKMPLAELHQKLATRSLEPLLIAPQWDEQTTVHHLPHPSGASRWLNDTANRALLNHALENLAQNLLDF